MYNWKEAYQRYLRFPENPTITAAFDFETTGLSVREGGHDNPFLLSVTFSDGVNWVWKARVDPLTRKATWDQTDLKEILTFFRRKDVLFVGSNKKFDIRCLKRICPAIDDADLMMRCHETIGMHHALQNQESHALKDAAAKYANIPVTDEEDLVKAVNKARHIAEKLGWCIAGKTTTPWQEKKPNKGWSVMDYWLPEALACHMWHTSEAGKYCALHACFGRLSPEQELMLQSLPGWEWRVPHKLLAKFGHHEWHTVAVHYCKLDTLRSVTLFRIFKEQLEQAHLWNIYQEFLVNSYMTYEMENDGVPLSIKLAKRELKRFTVDAEDAKASCGYSLSPLFPVNPRSSKQMQDILYGKNFFGLPIRRRTKPSKKNRRNPDFVGSPTTDKDFLADVVTKSAPKDVEAIRPPRSYKDIETYDRYLEKMSDWHFTLTDGFSEGRGKLNQLFAFSSSLLMYKQANTFVTQIQQYLRNAQYLSEDTEYALLYSDINPWGAKSTRQNSSNPGLHNTSKGGKQKKGIARFFKTKPTLRSLFAPPPGFEWWKVDYSQLQLVIFAFMANDAGLIAAARRGDDMHTATARIIFDYPTDPNDPAYHFQVPTDAERDLAKTVNFAFIFGAQEKKLEQTAGMPGLYSKLATRLPGAIRFLEEAERSVRRYGCVRTMGGYVLYVPENESYAASNYRIQGTEGEIVKRATYCIKDYLDRRGISRSEFRTILPVHDELNFLARKGTGVQLIGSICSIMEDAAKSYGVEAKVKAELCENNWSEGVVYQFDEKD